MLELELTDVYNRFSEDHTSLNYADISGTAPYKDTQVGTLTLTVKASGYLQSADLSSMHSTSTDVVSGTWGDHSAPEILNATAAEGGASEAGLGAGDTITVVFDKQARMQDPQNYETGIMAIRKAPEWGWQGVNGKWVELVKGFKDKDDDEKLQNLYQLLAVLGNKAPLKTHAEAMSAADAVKDASFMNLDLSYKGIGRLVEVIDAKGKTVEVGFWNKETDMFVGVDGRVAAQDVLQNGAYRFKADLEGTVREVSKLVAVRVIEMALEEDLCTKISKADVAEDVEVVDEALAPPRVRPVPFDVWALRASIAFARRESWSAGRGDCRPPWWPALAEPSSPCHHLSCRPS